MRIDNATGAGSVADYKGNEPIYVTDETPMLPLQQQSDRATTYQAKQEGNTVVLNRWN